MLMGMLFFVYAIIGMQLFGNLVIDSHTALQRHNNFRHIFQSLLVLFRFVEYITDLFDNLDQGQFWKLQKLSNMIKHCLGFFSEVCFNE